MRLGLSLDIESSGLARANHGNPLYYAAQYGLKLLLRADKGIQYGPTLRTGGTTPPAWTISGTATRQVGLRGRIASVAGGTGLGQATYDWSEDNGTTYIPANSGLVTAAGPTALGTTGLSVSMAVGPYNINNTWDITVAQWNDQSGAGNNVAQVTASAQPLFILNGHNGRPALRFDGTDDSLLKAGVDMFGSGAYSWVVAAKLNSAVALKILFGNAGTVGGGNYYYVTAAGAARGVGHPGAFAATDGAPTTNWEKVTLRRAAAAAPTLRIDGANQALSGTTTTLVAPTGPVIHIGSGPSGTFPQPCDVSDIVAYAGALPDSVATALEAGLEGF